MSRKVVCLVGSTRFLMEMAKVAHDEALAGNVVLRPHVVRSAKFELAPLSPQDRERLYEVREDEVRMADEVIVVAPGGYIGESTRRLLAVADEVATSIRWVPEARRPAATLPTVDVERLTAALHRHQAHPDYDYATTQCARKQGPADRPDGDGWELNVDKDEGWDRYEFHENYYWRRPTPEGA